MQISDDKLNAELGMSRNAELLKQSVGDYYRWNLSVFPMETHKRILDIGSGPGLYFDALMALEPVIYFATDYSDAFVAELRASFRGRPACRAGMLDLTAATLPPEIISQPFDYVLCFDVIEHIQDDEKAVRNLGRIVRATRAQWLFLRVPALQCIYGENDRVIGHYRRYSRDGLMRLLTRSGLRVRKIRYQNLLAILPWYVIGNWAKRSTAVSKGEGRLFNALVPFLRVMERLLPPPVGLSLYAICNVPV